MNGRLKTLVVLVPFLAAGGVFGPAARAYEPTLRGIYGSEHALGEFQDDANRALVLVFLDPFCPIAQQYLPRLAELHRRYNSFQRDRGGRPIKKDARGRWETFKYAGDRVNFLGIYPTPDLSVKDIAAHALEASVPFRVLHDHRQEVVRKFGVRELGEVVVLDRDWNVFYQGTIDDQFYPGGSKPMPTQHYLRDAVDALLAGNELRVKRRPPQGCIIAKRTSEQEPSPLTFHEHIQPILQAKCQTCHRAGEVGPMPLESYRDVTDYADMIEEVILDKRMPPWPGESPFALKNDYRLSEIEIETMVAWIRGGRKKGDPASAPPPVRWPQHGRWKIGEPDFIFEMKEPMRIPATGVVDYTYFPVKVDFPEDKYIRAIEVVPGDPRAVHHIQVHEFHDKIDEQGTAGASPLQLLSLYGASLNGARLLGNYSPGNNANARFFDSQSGMKLARGSNLMLELHYTPYGREAFDRSRVGICFTDKPPQREIQTHYFIRKLGDFLVPANQQHHSMQQLYHFEKPVKILAVRPHMHSRGKSFRLEMVNSADIGLREIHDRDSHLQLRGQTVLTVPLWDFNWQLTYEFVEPLILPRGKALLATGFWDNTKLNPRNPDWTEDAVWGQQVFHEMFNVMILYEKIDDNGIVAAEP